LQQLGTTTAQTGGDSVKANNDGANTKTFLFGAQGVIPYEKALVVTGTAPGSTAGDLLTLVHSTQSVQFQWNHPQLQ
jgi:hypothetical protein